MTDSQAVYSKFFATAAPDSKVAVIVINRPEAANAFNAEIMMGLTQEADKLARDKSCRAVLIQGAGKHFSAGADLNWMKSSAKLSYDENLKEAGRLTKMFEAIKRLPVPTIAVVRGAAFGGGVGIVAACDYAIATESAKFCLSEVKLGLIPAVILPYLQGKMHNGALHRFALSGRVFNSDEAKEAGLVQLQTSNENLGQVLHAEVNQILTAGAEAQATYKDLFNSVVQNHGKQGAYAAEAIAKIRATAPATAGLSAFFAGNKAPWVTSLPADCNLVI